jgi:basic membrane lipoprotein Med (substrate-binding protein (PBP1-ABC) superfamily)
LPRPDVGCLLAAMRLLAIACCALLLGACESAPIQVESAKAVVVQNETTKKHIKSFTDTNKKTQVHIKKVQEEAVESANAIDTAKKYLHELIDGSP